MGSESFLQSTQNDRNAVILDVRSAEEFGDGHVHGAINIPFTKKNEFLSLDKKKSYYLYCHTGGRSSLVAHFMSKAGFPKVINLREGIQYWPVEELQA